MYVFHQPAVTSVGSCFTCLHSAAVTIGNSCTVMAEQEVKLLMLGSSLVSNYGSLLPYSNRSHSGPGLMQPTCLSRCHSRWALQHCHSFLLSLCPQAVLPRSSQTLNTSMQPHYVPAGTSCIQSIQKVCPKVATVPCSHVLPPF